MVDETPAVVLLLVQTDNQPDARVAEDGYVVLRGESRKAIGVRGCGRRPYKGEELVWNDPVHVSILDLLKELVGLNVEAAVVEPPVLDRLLQAEQAVLDRQVEVADPAARVPERQKRRVHATEGIKGHLCRFSENHHLVRADEGRRVRPLLRLVGTIVDDSPVCQRRVTQLGLEPFAVAVHHRQVQWTEVCEEGLVDHVVVYGEVVCT
mmetsp:Transcript_41703/g.110153  ORF Transcript_41703/g.110153 Transcript_41703/m.110153 type:complete len:208 (-) Transcript_41703:227-850(-)